MSSMAAHAHARARTMRQSTLLLVEDALGEIAEPHSTANLGDVVGVKADLLEALEVNDHGTILSSQTECSIGMATSSRLDLDIVLGCASDRVGNMLDGRWEYDDGRGVRETKIVWLS